MATKKPKPAVDMTWLTSWIAMCLKGPTKATRDDFDHEMRLVRIKKNRTRFALITSDQNIINQLGGIYQTMLADPKHKANQASAQSAIQRFLISACWTPNHRLNIEKTKDRTLSSNRSDTYRDLNALAKSAKKLAVAIRALKAALGGATSSAYLHARFECAGTTPSLSSRRGYIKHSSPQKAPITKLQDLLVCFAEEATDAAQCLKDKVKEKREVEGKRAAQNSFIDMMLVAAKTLTTKQHPKPHFSLIAKIGSHIFSEGLDPSTVQKRHIA